MGKDETNKITFITPDGAAYTALDVRHRNIIAMRGLGLIAPDSTEFKCASCLRPIPLTGNRSTYAHCAPELDAIAYRSPYNGAYTCKKCNSKIGDEAYLSDTYHDIRSYPMPERLPNIGAYCNNAGHLTEVGIKAILANALGADVIEEQSAHEVLLSRQLSALEEWFKANDLHDVYLDTIR